MSHAHSHTHTHTCNPTLERLLIRIYVYILVTMMDDMLHLLSIVLYYPSDVCKLKRSHHRIHHRVCHPLGVLQSPPNQK